ncbi:MAG: TMEM43 family protein [Pirellulales bacterium]
MADRFTEVTHQGFFKRIANSVIGVLIGILFLFSSVLLLGWNEYRTVHRQKGLIEAESKVVKVADASQLDTSLEGKMLHLSGKADTEETLADPVFGIRRNALRYAREVEMYQWDETKHSKTRDKIGGGKETITTYEYHKGWHKDRVSSDSFHEKTGHENPNPKYTSLELDSENVLVGAFRLNSELIRSIHSWKNLTLDAETLLETLPEAERTRVYLDGDTLRYSVDKPKTDDPKVGDLRIRFRVVEPTTVSILSSLSGTSLTPFKTSNGEKIEELKEGVFSSETMFQGLIEQNIIMAWVLRFLGWIFASLGFVMISSPLSTLTGVVTMLGRDWFFDLCHLGGAGRNVVHTIRCKFALGWRCIPLWGILLLAAVAGVFSGSACPRKRRPIFCIRSSDIVCILEQIQKAIGEVARRSRFFWHAERLRQA